MSGKTMTDEDWDNLRVKTGRTFSPSAPIDEQTLFAGRMKQMHQTIDVCNQKGQHAILFGERGVGKTSLSNLLSTFYKVRDGASVGLFSPRINCDSSDNYTSIWKRVFSQIEITKKIRATGFKSEPTDLRLKYADQFGDNISPDEVFQSLMLLSANDILILIIDEFDRIDDSKTKTAIADTIKTLSDNSINITLILVGVADTIDELIEEHFSIERALVQIRIPRMSKIESCEIIDRGLMVLEMQIEDRAKDYIVLLSQGLPHYTHLLGLHSARRAIGRKSLFISFNDVEMAIVKSVSYAQQSTKSAYHKATMSVRDSIYPQVLIACALAKKDDLGYFAAADIRKPLSSIMKRKYDIPNFSRHLSGFCSNERGKILKRIGVERNYRFRFKIPLMQPYIIMQGLSGKFIDKEFLERQLK
jgi:Cdc6-like AAA superfamily ATPase